MKRFVSLLAATMLLAAPAYAQVAGKWQSEQPGRNGAAPTPVVLEIKADGTGTMTTGTQPASTLSKGKITGNKVEFVIEREMQGNKVEVKYAGELAGDKLTLTREGGMGGGRGGAGGGAAGGAAAAAGAAPAAPAAGAAAPAAGAAAAGAARAGGGGGGGGGQAPAPLVFTRAK